MVIEELMCKRCGHSWFPRQETKPKICPKCKSNKWNRSKSMRYRDDQQMNWHDKYGNQKMARSIDADDDGIPHTYDYMEMYTYGNPDIERYDEPTIIYCPKTGKSYFGNPIYYIHPDTGAYYQYCRICDENSKNYWDKWHYMPQGITRKEETEETDNSLMEMIVKDEGKTINQLAKLMDWTYGKTYASIQRLRKKGLIEIQENLVGRRKQYNVYTIKISAIRNEQQ